MTLKHLIAFSVYSFAALAAAQILFRSNATAGQIPKLDVNHTLSNSLIADNGSNISIGGMSVAANGIITFANGQTFPLTGTGGGTGIANVVGTFKAQGQSTGIPDTTLITPTNDGLYRLSYYATTTTADNSGASFAAIIVYTDDAGDKTGTPLPGGATNCGSPLSGSGGTFIVEAKAGHPIVFHMQQNFTPVSCQYSFFMTTEQLM